MSEKDEYLTTLSDIIFSCFLEKLEEDGVVDFSNDVSVANSVETITSTFAKEGVYAPYIDSILKHFGYSIREDDRIDQLGFDANMQRIYGYSFFHLDLMYLLSIELGSLIFDNLTSSSPLSLVMQHQHVRTLQIFAEIKHLLKGGFGNGAMVRFRSMHESVVIMKFISKHGVKCAEAYMDYLVIMKAKDIKYINQLYNEKNPLTEYVEMKEQFERKYGSDFVDLSKSDLTWAKQFIKGNNSNITFSKLRNSLKIKHGREQYKNACNIIHSAPKSLLSSIGTEDGLPNVGASDRGITEPAGWAVYELVQLNELIVDLFMNQCEFNKLSDLRPQLILDLLKHLTIDTQKCLSEVSLNKEIEN